MYALVWNNGMKALIQVTQKVSKLPCQCHIHKHYCHHKINDSEHICPHPHRWWNLTRIIHHRGGYDGVSLLGDLPQVVVASECSCGGRWKGSVEHVAVATLQ